MIGRRLSEEQRRQAAKHIKYVARQVGARVWFVQARAHCMPDDVPCGRANFKTRRVVGPPITTALDYLIHLHELGHLANPEMPYGFADEAQAWSFAVSQALPAITATMTKTAWAAIGRWLSEYMQVDAGIPLRKR